MVDPAEHDGRTGHRPEPAAGPAGRAQDYGRRATFGGSPSHLGALRPGDTITAIAGTSTTAAAFSDKISGPGTEPQAPADRVLRRIPSYYYQVDADLTSSVRPSPGVARVVYASELPLANDSSTLAMTMVWSLALALVAAIGTVAASRWSRWAAYLAMVPLAMAVLWNLYENLAALLPNLY